MKKLIYIIIITFSFAACESTSKNLGEKFEVKNPISVDAALALLNDTIPLQDVQVEGVINKSCMSEGCWITIKGKTESEVLFTVTDKKFRIPTNSPGEAVVVLVDAKATEKNTADKELPKNELYIKGLLFK